MLVRGLPERRPVVVSSSTGMPCTLATMPLPPARRYSQGWTRFINRNIHCLALIFAPRLIRAVMLPSAAPSLGEPPGTGPLGRTWRTDHHLSCQLGSLAAGGTDGARPPTADIR